MMVIYMVVGLAYLVNDLITYQPRILLCDTLCPDTEI